MRRRRAAECSPTSGDGEASRVTATEQVPHLRNQSGSITPLLRISIRFTLVPSAKLPWENIPNLPHTAQVVETLDDGVQVRHETKLFQARDSQGRTRIEIFSSATPCGSHDSDPPVMVDLFVPLHRQFIQLIPAQKTAHVMTFPDTDQFLPMGKP
jgi:hypothetical protein